MYIYIYIFSFNPQVETGGGHTAILWLLYKEDLSTLSPPARAILKGDLGLGWLICKSSTVCNFPQLLTRLGRLAARHSGLSDSRKMSTKWKVLDGTGAETIYWKIFVVVKFFPQQERESVRTWRNLRVEDCQTNAMAQVTGPGSPILSHRNQSFEEVAAKSHLW